MNSKKEAFTLAEILITLGIIGVVAAMTMPSLFNSIQKRTTLAKLQKAFATINQAYRLSYNDNGDLTKDEAWAFGADEYFKTYWAPYIKADECTNFRQCGYSSSFAWQYLNGSQYNMVLTSKGTRIAFYTPEGFLYQIMIASGWVDNQKSNGYVVIDINGSKNPNTVGKDVFIFERMQNEGGVAIVPLCYTYTDTQINSNCSRTGSGICCAEKIRRAGWKIDASYPW